MHGYIRKGLRGDDVGGRQNLDSQLKETYPAISFEAYKTSAQCCLQDGSGTLG